MSYFSRSKRLRLMELTGFDKIKPTKVYCRYETLAIYDFESIYNKLKNNILNNTALRLMKTDMKMSSERYHLFTSQDCVCVDCGVRAKFWALQRTKESERPHLNLYGISEKGEIRLFTKDHIIPKSKGGKNDMKNYQIMCDVCNNKKGNNMEGEIKNV